MKKFMSALLVLAMLASVLPLGGVFADGAVGVELYSVTYQNEQLIVDGRAFSHDRGRVMVTAAPSGGSGVSSTVDCGNDGRFTASFSASLTAYQVTAVTDTGAKTTAIADFSGFSGLFSGQTNYSFGVMISHDGLSLVGTHTGAANAVVTLRVVDANPAVNDLSMVAWMADTQSDGDKNFKLDMQLQPGTYILRLKAKDVPQESYTFTCPANDSNLYAPDENEFATLLHRLNTYADTLERKISQCEAASIPVDYERAYLEIIKKYITYAEREVYYGETYRMGNFLYSLTRIYNEAMENLAGYLAGSKRAYTVAQLKSGPIRIDGTSVVASMDTDGMTVERPAFLVGYGIWDTVEDEVEFLSSIGSNFIQSDFAMQEVFSQIRGGGWMTQTYMGESATVRSMTEIKTSADAARSGSYSLKVNNQSLVTDSYRYVHQRFRVKPNTTYVYGLSAKAASMTTNAASFNIFERFTGKRQYLNKNVGVTGWQDYQFEYTTDAFQEWLDFTLMFTNLITDLYIDDIYVYEKGSNVNLLANGSFDDYTSSPTAYDAEAEGKGWYINLHTLANLHRILANAEANNVAVDVLIGPAPVDFMYHSGLIPEVGTGFTTFPLDNAAVREAISLFCRLIADELKSETAAVSLCLINEPEVKAWYSDGYYQEKWEAWLREKYDNNAWALYQAHGDWSFDGARMPSVAPQATASSKAKIKYHDYITFNDSLLSEFHIWYAGEVKKANPDIPVHTKTMQYLRKNYQNYLIQGTNYDLVAEALDLNGCDAWSEYANEGSLTAKMAWYDLMTSTIDQPVWNTEDHVTGGGDIYDADGNLIRYQTLYNDLEPLFVASDIWNGAVHGRGASAIWVWNDSVRTMVGWNSSVHSNLNVIHKPEQVAKTAKAAMDLNRLAEEVTAISKEQAKVGILYSRTSVTYMHEQGTNGFHDYANPHMDAVLQAYEDVIESGQKAGFITDGVYDNMAQYDLVIIPQATYVSANILNAIAAYQSGGGEVLILGTDSLTMNEANQSHNSTTVSSIKAAADTASTVKGKIQAMGLSHIVLVDAATNAPLTDVEWSYAPYNGGYVVNVLNYNYDSHKSFKLLMDGGEVGSFTDLRSGNATANGVMTAKTLEPMLLEIKAYTFDVISESGEVLQADIDKVQAGKIRCTTPQTGGTLVLALYENDALIKASLGTGIIEVPQLADGKDYRLMAAYWDMETLQPLLDSRRIDE